MVKFVQGYDELQQFNQHLRIRLVEVNKERNQHLQVQKDHIAQYRLITSSIGAPLSQIMTSGSLVGGSFEHLTSD